MSTAVIVFLVMAIIAVAFALLALVVARRPAAARRPAVAQHAGAPLTVTATGVATAVLEIEEADPASPIVQRLVHEAALRVFRAMPDARDVEVRSQTGTLLGSVSRKTPLPRELNLSPLLSEPHTQHRHSPDLSRHLSESQLPSTPPPAPLAQTAEDLVPPRRTLADEFDLPEVVRAGIRDPNDPVDLMRAMMEAAGIRHEVDGDLIRAGELALVVLRASGDVTVGHDALNHAYLRVVRSGAQRGLVIGIGYVDPREVKRREVAAPQVLHTGPDGIQRMADAVALGADPLRFAVAIPFTGSR